MPRLQRVPITSLKLHEYASSPELPLKISRWFGIFLILLVPLLIFVPWQQAVVGTGRVTAFSPTEREQEIHAPVAGRIVKWHVIEGTSVKVGQPILEMADIDPDYLRRIEERLQADRDRIEFASERLAVYEAQAAAYESAREMKVASMRLKVKMAEQKLKVAQQKAQVAEATRDTARLNATRTQQLAEKGIASTRQRELAELELAKAEAEWRLSQAEASEAEASRLSAEAEVMQADAEGGAKVATAQAEAQKARSEQAYAKGDVAKLEVERSRQLAQIIVAPADGTIVKISGNLGGGVVKEGQLLANMIPNTSSRVVEVYVEGNDAPLITRGRTVRLQFEGWPALQFIGWPSIAVGTFAGVVSFIDPAATDAQGRVRLLIQPDPHSQPWPDAKFLRQQVRTKAWVLLDNVSLGWELWRRINGFPPTFASAPEGQVNSANQDPQSPKEQSK